MARTNQGGSILGYAVVAIVLAILLVGGAYALNRMTAQPEVVQEPAPAPQPSTDGTDKSEEKKPAEEKDKAPAETSNPKEQTEKQPEKTEDKKAQSHEIPSGGSSKHLPETGPGDLLVSAVMLGLLSAVGISYLRSRRFAVSL